MSRQLALLLLFACLAQVAAEDSVSFDQTGQREAAVVIEAWKGPFRKSHPRFGSGVCVAQDRERDRALFLTAAHVVENAGNQLTIRTHAGEYLGASVVASDRQLDVAALVTYLPRQKSVPSVPLMAQALTEGATTEVWGFAPHAFRAQQMQAVDAAEVWIRGPRGVLACQGDSGGAVVEGGRLVGLVQGTATSGEHHHTVCVTGPSIRSWAEKNLPTWKPLLTLR